MDFSISETEELILRAMRGSYLSWGLAEDAAKAVGWLERHDLPGTSAAAALIAGNDGRDMSDLGPVEDLHSWVANRGHLCPIVTGTWLLDRAPGILDHPIRFTAVDHPLLLLPFVAAASMRTRTPLGLTWAGTLFVAKGHELAVPVGTETPNPSFADDVGVLLDARSSVGVGRKRTRAKIEPNVESVLTAFAQRTYVPASEASRSKGAGAGLVDFD